MKIPTIRRIFPQLIASELVGVQPMNRPSGFAFDLRPFEYELALYEKWKANDPANNTASFEEFVERHMPIIREVGAL